MHDPLRLTPVGLGQELQRFAFARRGGRRPGAGRKPKGERPGVSHKTREALAARFPVHVTVRLERGLPGLRDKQTYRALKRAFAAGSDRFGFRLTQYSRSRAECRGFSSVSPGR